MCTKAIKSKKLFKKNRKKYALPPYRSNRRIFMSRSEFRYNRKRKHYAYLFKDIGSKRKIIVLSSKPYRKEHKKIKKNIKLFMNPNPNNKNNSFLIPKIYIDDICSFDGRKLKWGFHPNDKRKVKRIQKKKNI